MSSGLSATWNVHNASRLHLTCPNEGLLVNIEARVSQIKRACGAPVHVMVPQASVSKSNAKTVAMLDWLCAHSPLSPYSSMRPSCTQTECHARASISKPLVATCSHRMPLSRMCSTCMSSSSLPGTSLQPPYTHICSAQRDAHHGLHASAGRSAHVHTTA